MTRKVAIIFDNDTSRTEKLKPLMENRGFEVKLFTEKSQGQSINQTINTLGPDDKTRSIFIASSMEDFGLAFANLALRNGIPSMMLSGNTGHGVSEDDVQQMRDGHKKPVGFYQYGLRSKGGKGFEPEEAVRIANETIKNFATARGESKGL